MQSHKPFAVSVSAGILVLVSACASIGNPSGGPRDEDPPRFVKSTPAPGSVDFTGNKVSIEFDELVNVRDAMQKVTVSPPMRNFPRISSLGRRVNVEFTDTLLPNTTYTIDFADAIVDNNESNALTDFRYSFSTGAVLDTLTVSGMVLGAADLEPQQKMIVGLYGEGPDSIFRTRPFDYISRTDSRGRFVISGLPARNYRIFALEDKDNNFIYSSPEETIAFYDGVITPSAERIVTTDTILNLKTGAVDTVVQRERTLFLPNNVLLRSFTSDYKQQYITKYERRDSTAISLIFNSRSPGMPEISVVGAPRMRDWAVVEKSEHNDSILLWLKNPALVKADTLRLAVNYTRRLPGLILEEVSDTLRFITQRPKETKRNKKEATETETPKEQLFNWKTPGGVHEIDALAVLEAPMPLGSLNPEMIRLEMKNDTVWKTVNDFSISEPDTLKPGRYTLRFRPEYGTTYRLTVDSLAATTIYGMRSAPVSAEFRTRDEKEYSSIRFRISGFAAGDSLSNDSILMVQLLNGQDKPVRTERVENGVVTFRHLLAGNYYARIVIDSNIDGRVTAGDYDYMLQPEPVYYYPHQIVLKQNWEQELDWDIFGTPVNKMKPAELLKNRPE